MSLKFWVHAPFYWVDMNRPYADLLHEMIDIAQAAESLGFEGVSVPETQFSNYIGVPSTLQFISALAMKTTTLKLLSGVIVLPQYHPILLAGQVTLADHLSEGRLSVGVARGGGRRLVDILGLDSSRQQEMYEESLEILLALWQQEDYGHEGRFWTFPPVTVLPRPYQQPVPKLWVAAQSEAGVRRVGLKGQNLLTSPNLGNFAPHGDIDVLLKAYNEAAGESGSPRGEVMVLRHIFIDDTEALALKRLDATKLHWAHYMSGYANSGQTREDRLGARVERHRESRGGRVIPADVTIERDDVYGHYDDPILTSPERAIERFRHYEGIGVNHVAGVTAMGFPVEDTIRSMELMAKYVFPAFA